MVKKTKALFWIFIVLLVFNILLWGINIYGWYDGKLHRQFNRGFEMGYNSCEDRYDQYNSSEFKKYNPTKKKEVKKPCYPEECYKNNSLPSECDHTWQYPVFCGNLDELNLSDTDLEKHKATLKLINLSYPFYWEGW